MSGAADFSEFRAFAADLREAPTKVVLGARGVIAKGAGAIKDQMRTEMAASVSFKGVARAITYDIDDAAGLSAAIGPTRGRPGSLANVAYFGGSNGGGGTVPDPIGALNAESPKVEAALARLMWDAL